MTVKFGLQSMALCAAAKLAADTLFFFISSSDLPSGLKVSFPRNFLSDVMSFD
jgi:hypothetical protein